MGIPCEPGSSPSCYCCHPTEGGTTTSASKATAGRGTCATSFPTFQRHYNPRHYRAGPVWREEGSLGKAASWPFPCLSPCRLQGGDQWNRDSQQLSTAYYVTMNIKMLLEMIFLNIFKYIFSTCCLRLLNVILLLALRTNFLPQEGIISFLKDSQWAYKICYIEIYFIAHLDNSSHHILSNICMNS